MAAKRPSPSCDVSSLARKPSRRNVSRSASNYIFNDLQQLNTTESPLLRLPAELRNRIYELVFGDYLIHVEHATVRPGTGHDSLRYAEEPLDLPHLISLSFRDKTLRYYICKSSLAEDDAYQRSKDASLNEQTPFVASNHLDLQNYWRMGDRFHIDQCKNRHGYCIPDASVPNWMFTSWGKLWNRTPTHLNKILNLDVTRVCRQIHDETKLLPFYLNIFAFRQATAFLEFFSSLRSFQGQGVKEVCLFMTAGQYLNDPTLTSQWNSALFVPTLLERVKGLRILHISITISHNKLGGKGPIRSDLADPVQLDSWVIGLQRLRGLPLRDVTVIVSDDPYSKFGIEGFCNMIGGDKMWLALRERECFTAEEKRQWAEGIKNMLLGKSVRPSQSTTDA